MGDVFERLSEAVCGHVLRNDVLELKMTVAYPILDVVVVDIDVLGALVVTFNSTSGSEGWLPS
jgi:hypothetical protein